tara:strand:- start:311 stop:457 length:147 start_codon:yes stop_codon:yes gene_type:complete
MHNTDKDSHLHTDDGDIIFTKDNYSKKEKRKLTQKELNDKLKTKRKVK